MTVPSGQNPIKTYRYTAPADYDFTFRVMSVSDLLLTMIDVNGVREVMTYGADYTISLLDSGDNGGTCHVTYTTTGGLLEIRRAVVVEQPTDWNNNNAFNAELLEFDLDRLTLIVQDMDTLLSSELLQGAWRGDWQANTPYFVNELVRGPDRNWYTCTTDHTSTTDFTVDLADAEWILVFDVVYIEGLAAASAQSESNAASSETNAASSEANASNSALSAGQSATNASGSASTALVASDSATISANAAAASASDAESIVALGERVDSVKRDDYTATAGQTAFTITEPAPEDNILVFMNSRTLRLTEDYTLNSATAASVLTLNDGADAGDEISIVSFNVALVGGTGLESITESGNTGWRLVGADPANYGNIGDGSVDLSYSAANTQPYGATGTYSNSNGRSTIASGTYSNVNGYYSIASGDNGANANGRSTEASGNEGANSNGLSTLAQNNSQTSIGKYNVGTSTTTIFEVGIGAFLAKANALEVHTTGNVVLPAIPTSDPGLTGALWNDSGTLKISL